MSEKGEKAITAQYSSLSGEEVFTLPLSAKCPPNPSTSEKTAYLSELRSSAKTLQENVNGFLTEKMEEDKAREAREKGAKTKTQDEIEEEQYGEEPVEED